MVAITTGKADERWLWQVMLYKFKVDASLHRRSSQEIYDSLACELLSVSLTNLIGQDAVVTDLCDPVGHLQVPNYGSARWAQSNNAKECFSSVFGCLARSAGKVI